MSLCVPTSLVPRSLELTVLSRDPFSPPTRRCSLYCRTLAAYLYHRDDLLYVRESWKRCLAGREKLVLKKRFIVPNPVNPTETSRPKATTMALTEASFNVQFTCPAIITKRTSQKRHLLLERCGLRANWQLSQSRSLYSPIASTAVHFQFVEGVSQLSVLKLVRVVWLDSSNLGLNDYQLRTLA